MIRKACSDALLAGCLLLLAAAAHADLEFSGAWLRAVPPVWISVVQLISWLPWPSTSSAIG